MKPWEQDYDTDIPSGGTGIAEPPPQQGWKVSPADQALRDQARLAILSQERADNPNDQALAREHAAEAKKQGGVPVARKPWEQEYAQPSTSHTAGPATSILNRTIAGLSDPIYGAAQIADKAINPIRQMISPGASSMEDVIRQRDAEYVAPEGFDVARLVGNMANPINYMGAAAPIRAGATTAMLQPTDADNMTLKEKAKQALIGGGIGGLSKAVGAVRQGAKPTEDALRYQDVIKGANVLAGKPPTPVLTPGQLAPEGGWLRKAEEALADVPGVGALLRKRQEAAMQGFQATTRAEALPPLQALPNMGDRLPDATTLAGLKRGFEEAYDTLLGNVKIQVGRNPIDNSPITESARKLQMAESEAKNQAARMMRSNDLATMNEGHRLMAEAKAAGEQWRGQLPRDVQMMLRGVDGQYAAFAPLKKASEKYATTLITPEAYTPKDLLRVLRNKPGEAAGRQRDLTMLAESVIGSVPPKTTIRGGIGLGGVGLGSLLLGQGPLAAGIAAAGLGYGTKTGQKVARGAQRALTADELAIAANILRRGAAPAAIQQADD